MEETPTREPAPTPDTDPRPLQPPGSLPSEDKPDAGATKPAKTGDAIVTIRVPLSVLYAIAGVAVGLVAGFFVGRMTSGGTAASQSATEPPVFVDVSVKGRPFQGPKNAAVTVVEFTDYQCPFCERFFKETYRPLLKAYRGKIRYVVRNFPIAQAHPLAQKAAEAAECANDQGKFWEYHDVLFTNQDRLGVRSLKRNASDLNLDRGRFDKCLDNGDKADAVQADLNDGTRYGITGTPTFFVNGERLTGAQPLGAFRASIDAKLKKNAG